MTKLLISETTDLTKRSQSYHSSVTDFSCCYIVACLFYVRLVVGCMCQLLTKSTVMMVMMMMMMIIVPDRICLTLNTCNRQSGQSSNVRSSLKSSRLSQRCDVRCSDASCKRMTRTLCSQYVESPQIGDSRHDKTHQPLHQSVACNIQRAVKDSPGFISQTAWNFSTKCYTFIQSSAFMCQM